MRTRRALLVAAGLGGAAAALGAFGWSSLSPFADAPSPPLRLRDRGPAPALDGAEGWLNSAPLSLAALRGQAVLLEFWALSCVNCIRTIPHVRAWRDAYGASGLRVIGVHTPEFPREAVRANVEVAAARLHVDYPVALDSRRAIWDAYGLRAWPTLVLIDRHGRIVLTHEGEGEEQQIGRLIRAALARA